MKDVIVVLDKLEIPLAANLQPAVPDAEIWVFDPNLIDSLSWAGASNYRFIECEPDIDLVQHTKSIEHQTISTEERIDSVLGQSFPEALGCHWQYLNLYHQLNTINIFALLWKKLLSISGNVKFHILIHDVPARYSAPSYWPSILLLERLNGLQMPFSAYSYNRLDDANQLIPAGEHFASGSERFKAFIHLPTCFYDSKYYEQEINAVSANFLNFGSMDYGPLIWSVPLPSLRTVGLCSAEEVLKQLPASQTDAISQTTANICSVLSEIYSSFVRTQEYADRQANYLAKQYESQMIFYCRLVSEFSALPPLKLVLSNHDAGFHGPLTSFARKLGIPVVLLPHSKIFNWPVTTSYPNTIALTHPLQEETIRTVDGAPVASHLIAFPESQSNSCQPPQSLSRIGLIINDLSGGGYTLVRTDEYSEGLRTILAWCQSRNIHCKPRVRPGGTCFSWLINSVGFDNSELAIYSLGSIADFAKDCDICVMYDCPTSGAIDLLKRSIPIIHTVFRPLCSRESGISNTKIIPQEFIEDTLTRLECYRTNPQELFVFRTRQFALYAASFRDSKPLRMFL